MNFVRVWLLGVIHPVRSLDELKDKPAPQWGLWAVLIRFVTTALIETLPLYVLGREPFAPSYLTFLATKNYYSAEVFFLPLFGVALWLLMSALAHVLLRISGKSSDIDRILNIVGLGMLIPMPVLWTWDVAMIMLNNFTTPVSALSHATVQVWEASIEAAGLHTTSAAEDPACHPVSPGHQCPLHWARNDLCSINGSAFACRTKPYEQEVVPRLFLMCFTSAFFNRLGRFFYSSIHRNASSDDTELSNLHSGRIKLAVKGFLIFLPPNSRFMRTMLAASGTI